MSMELIDRWIDDDVDDESKSKLEEWLRDDPKNLRIFFEAVQWQEALREYCDPGLFDSDLSGRVPSFVESETVPVLSQEQKKLRLIVGLRVVAATLVACFFIIPLLSGPYATDDPRVWVISGNPQVIVARRDPGPQPAAIPREQWPLETRVTVVAGPCSLRWDKGCVLEAGAGTSLAMRSSVDDAPGPRSVLLDSGVLTVRLEADSVGVDVFFGDARIRASRPAAFTLKDPGPQPFGREAALFVSGGDVELQLPHSESRRVTAGERVSIP